MNENSAREEICRIGKSLFDRGYAHATAGNISMRVEGTTPGFLITPTDACLGFLDPAKLAKLDAEGKQVSGDRASKTIALHRRIYETSSHTTTFAGCVIHTHSTYCVALSLAQRNDREARPELVDALTPYFLMKVGHVPVIDYQTPGSELAAEDVGRVIRRYAELGTPIRAVMLARLGPNVWHANGAGAMAALEELEETAKLAVLTRDMPAPPLDEVQINALRETFNAQW